MDGCVPWGSQVVIPTAARSLVVQQLHDCHPGISKMKSLACSYVWWPGLDDDITRTIQQCEICQNSRPSPPSAPLHPWEWPSRPWSRIHIDRISARKMKFRDKESQYFFLKDKLNCTSSINFQPPQPFLYRVIII